MRRKGRIKSNNVEKSIRVSTLETTTPESVGFPKNVAIKSGKIPARLNFAPSFKMIAT